MFILFTILISLFLGFNMGVTHERKKYVYLDDDEEYVIKQEKEKFSKKVKDKIKRNMF